MTGEPIAITGLGTVGPHGIGAERLGAALAEGRALASIVDRSAGYHAIGSSRMAGLVPKVDLSAWVPPAEARRFSMPSRYAVAAGRMAVEDAGFPTLAGRNVAIILATSFGALLFTEKLVRQILDEGPESAQPFYFSECVANAAAARLALALGAHGANVTITEREAGPLLALARGVREVQDGRAEIAVVGAVDEMTPLVHALLDRFRGPARPARDHEEAARPFEARRNGVLAGEGASVVVLERASDAQARGAHPKAFVTASVAAFDSTAPVVDWGTGAPHLAKALHRGLSRAGCDIGSIDLIVSGASGACRGDRVEAHTLAAAWSGATLPPVVVPKAVVGEYGGGFLASAVLATQGAAFGKVAAFAVRDPELSVAPHDGRPLTAPSRLLATSLAAGGAAAWAVLERP
jgi:3-oxoacyl-[acyl-carrier-protein] synthase II